MEHARTTGCSGLFGYHGRLGTFIHHRAEVWERGPSRAEWGRGNGLVVGCTMDWEWDWEWKG
jgi:hypothetical protein